MKFNQAARLFLAALAAGSLHCSSAKPCPPPAGNCPPEEQVLRCKGCLYKGECAAESAGFFIEDDCKVIRRDPDPTKACLGLRCIKTASPSEMPSSLPSASPSTSPSQAPSNSPSASPSEVGWSEVAKLTAGIDGAADDYFGISVAISGDTAIVGANGDDDKGSASGSAYIFEKALDGSWNQTAKLLLDDGDEGDRLGYSVAISGYTAIVGAYGDDNDKGINAGSAYIFEKVGNSWNQVPTLTAGNDGAAGDSFGYSVATSGDMVIVGAYGDDEYSGSAYIFEKKIDGSWNQVSTKLTADDGAAYDYFGISVAISGGTAIVGAAYGDNDNGNIKTGSAYIFEKKFDGSWNQVAKLTAADGDAYDFFAGSVAISGDTAIVGAYGDDDVSKTSGSAYIFEKDGDGFWNQTVTKLTAGLDGAEDDQFGYSVAISGGTAIVGAWRDEDNSGSAYSFEKVNGSWNQVAKLTAIDGAEKDYFGFSVAISGDTAIVGAYADDDADTGLSNSGSAYIFETPK